MLHTIGQLLLWNSNFLQVHVAWSSCAASECPKLKMGPAVWSTAGTSPDFKLGPRHRRTGSWVLLIGGFTTTILAKTSTLKESSLWKASSSAVITHFFVGSVMNSRDVVSSESCVHAMLEASVGTDFMVCKVSSWRSGSWGIESSWSPVGVRLFWKVSCAC
jgi:hypothetical protein